LLVVNTPANPTDGVFAAEDLEQIVWWADRHDVLLFSDEVFARCRHGGAGRARAVCRGAAGRR
jgi:aspartate/methionine/tyrosine aminotransferase